MRLLAVAAAVLAAVCASGCRAAAPDGPPEIRLGIDVCDGCGMAIAEPRHAAAAVAEEGALRRSLRFDDIGCLARWEANAPGLTLRARWVHDRPSEEWIDAGTATFVHVRELSTPMGSGLSAFRNVSDAEILVVERGGETLSWNAILARTRDGSLLDRPQPRQEVAK